METLLQDLRYAARCLAKAPAFTLVAILTLAIGIGANTAIYTVVDATVLRNLPLKDADRLMHVSLTAGPMFGHSGNDDVVWSYPKYEAFLKLQHVFQSCALYTGQEVILTGTGDAQRLSAEQVSASYFDILGEHALVGRTFRSEEDITPGRDFIVVLSYALWQHSFGGDKGVTGKTIHLDNKPYTVVGVLPPHFHALTGPTDIWYPIHTTSAAELSQAQSHNYSMIAKLLPDVSVADAKKAMPPIGARIDALYKGPVGGAWSARARTLDEARSDPTLRRSVLILFGAVGFVLLIACANIANLLLARASARGREIAVRLAIGAARERLIRQMLTESLLLSALGGVAGLGIARIGVVLLTAINPATVPAFGRRISGLTIMGFQNVHLDVRALFFTFATAIAMGVLFGLAPALQASGVDLASGLKRGASQTGAAGLNLLSGKSALVVAEIALSLILLTGAGLMLKSYQRMLSMRIGIDPENVLTMRMSLPDSEVHQATAFWSEVERRAAALPGVESAGLGNCYALAGRCNATILTFRDRPEAAPGTAPTVGVQFVSPDSFRTLKIPLLRGRGFTSADHAGAPKVVLINQTAAQQLWPGEDPIGKPVAVGQGGFSDGAEVVGIVGDVRYARLDAVPVPTVYISYLQSTRTSLILFVRSARDASDLTAAVREQVRQIEKDVPVFDAMTMNERIRSSTAASRFTATLLAVFAGVAILLAAIGIYGTLSYLVSQRTREIGIRVAMGARPLNVVGLVLVRGAFLTAIGLAVGLIGAYASTRLLASMLYQIKPDDPGTFAEIALLLGAVALSATVIPARRAAKVDAMVALRSE